MRATLAGTSRGRDPSVLHLSVSAIIPFVPNPGFEPWALLRTTFVLRVSTRLVAALPQKIILPNPNCAMYRSEICMLRDKPYQGTVAISLSYSTPTFFFFFPCFAVHFRSSNGPGCSDLGHRRVIVSWYVLRSMRHLLSSLGPSLPLKASLLPSSEAASPTSASL
jgi:hypothetical protein